MPLPSSAAVDLAAVSGPAPAWASAGNAVAPGHAAVPGQHAPSGPADGPGHDGSSDHSVPPGYGLPPGYAYEAPAPGRFASFFIRLAQRMPSWAGPAGVALLGAGGVAYTLLVDPTAQGAASQPTCVVKFFTGFDCPGCGGTRAAWYMLHGDLGAAARHHAPLVFATPFLIYMYLSWALGSVTKRVKLPQLGMSMAVVTGFLAAWIVFSVARNLPWQPFTWLFV